MTNTRLGYLQKQMVSFMRKSIDLYGPAISRAFHIHSDAESRRIASSLEKRDIIYIDRAYEMWLVRPNLDHPVFNQ
jgi:hypothetical protein